MDKFGFCFTLHEIEILVSSTGNFNTSMKKLKNNASVGSTGHIDDKIDLAGSEGLKAEFVSSSS